MRPQGSTTFVGLLHHCATQVGYARILKRIEQWLLGIAHVVQRIPTVARGNGWAVSMVSRGFLKSRYLEGPSFLGLSARILKRIERFFVCAARVLRWIRTVGPGDGWAVTMVSRGFVDSVLPTTRMIR